MKLSLGQFILKRVKELGYRSLMNFYKNSELPFSYEYMRRLALDLQVPGPKKIGDLALALKSKRSEVVELATRHKFIQTAQIYYGKSLENEELETKALPIVDPNSPQGLREYKFLKIYRLLPPDQQEQVGSFIQFLRQQDHKQKGTASA